MQNQAGGVLIEVEGDGCALDQFMRKLPALINWAPRGSTLLLFGGETLGEQLRRANVNFEQLLIPQSEKRYLFLATG